MNENRAINANDHNQQFTQSQLYKLGFTHKMIETLLPPPTLKANPYFPNGAPLKLWDKAVVDAAMETDTFREYEGKASFEYGIPVSELNKNVRFGIPVSEVNKNVRFGIPVSAYDRAIR